MQPRSAIESGFVDIGHGTHDITKNMSINNNSELPNASNDSARSENIATSKDQADTNRELKLMDRAGNLLQRNERSGSKKLNQSEDVGCADSDDEIEETEGIRFGKRNKIAQVLTLGAGGDNQSHVIRPRTAKPVAASGTI